ncbi:MAG: hypothetical protein QXI16_01075 [Sulfolobaceae archaeon]
MPKPKKVDKDLDYDDEFEDLEPTKPFKDPLSAWTNPQSMSVEKDPAPIEIMINEMLGRENLEMKTDLSDRLVVALTRGSIYANLFNNKLMGDLVNNISLYRVSRNRKGRDEIKEMAKSLGSVMSEDSPSFMSRLFKGD